MRILALVFFLLVKNVDGFSSKSLTMVSSKTRRTVLSSSMGGMLGGLFGGPASASGGNKKTSGDTNEVVRVVKGMKHRRLGGSDIFVSELGLGTQRWVSTDFNAPDQESSYALMDEAVKHGINLIDTAEQYPIPSDAKKAKEGDGEKLIGQWMEDRKVPRSDMVIATKITGGRNINPANIKADCEGSLQRLQTDYIDVYQVRTQKEFFVCVSNFTLMYLLHLVALATTILSSIKLGSEFSIYP